MRHVITRVQITHLRTCSGVLNRQVYEALSKRVALYEALLS